MILDEDLEDTLWTPLEDALYVKNKTEAGSLFGQFLKSFLQAQIPDASLGEGAYYTVTDVAKAYF